MIIKNGDLPSMPQCDRNIQTLSVSRGLNAVQLSGLTKREQFAMAAMQGLFASLTADDDLSPRELARSAVLNADELLAELEK